MLWDTHFFNKLRGGTSLSQALFYTVGLDASLLNNTRLSKDRRRRERAARHLQKLLLVHERSKDILSALAAKLRGHADRTVFQDYSEATRLVTWLEALLSEIEDKQHALAEKDPSVHHLLAVEQVLEQTCYAAEDMLDLETCYSRLERLLYSLNERLRPALRPDSTN